MGCGANTEEPDGRVQTVRLRVRRALVHRHCAMSGPVAKTVYTVAGGKAKGLTRDGAPSVGCTLRGVG